MLCTVSLLRAQLRRTSRMHAAVLAGRWARCSPTRCDATRQTRDPRAQGIRHGPLIIGDLGRGRWPVPHAAAQAAPGGALETSPGLRARGPAGASTALTSWGPWRRPACAMQTPRRRAPWQLCGLRMYAQVAGADGEDLQTHRHTPAHGGAAGGGVSRQVG